MALEGVVFNQDPFLGCYFTPFGSFNFDPQLSYQNVMSCDDSWEQCYYPHASYDYDLAAAAKDGGCPAAGDTEVAGRRKRRRRTAKNKEEVESQRMTHIAVERNRRKQMNEYLASIRSLMPSSYVQRGDQASIIGGAINYVKELEQQLQSLEAHKIASSKQQLRPANDISSDVIIGSSGSASFSDFFSFPQYSVSRVDQGGSGEDVEKIEVNMADSHASVKILAKRKPKQLRRLVAGFYALRLGVLHANVTTAVDGFVLYSFSLKVEEGCHLSTGEEIAGAANHILST